MIPGYACSAAGFGRNGGSKHLWPKESGGGDDVRDTLSVWGFDLVDPANSPIEHTVDTDGGCCSTSIKDSGSAGGLPFKVWYGVELLPPNTALTAVAGVTATTTTDDAYWSSICMLIPPNALYVKGVSHARPLFALWSPLHSLCLRISLVGGEGRAPSAEGLRGRERHLRGGCARSLVLRTCNRRAVAGEAIPSAECRAGWCGGALPPKGT
jgi:hypothetical protein